MPKYTVRKIGMDPKNIVLITKENNKSVVPQARFTLQFGQKIIPVDQVLKTDQLLEDGEIGLSDSIIKSLGVKVGEMVELQPMGKISSKGYSLVKQRISQPGRVLEKDEIDTIVNEINTGIMSPLESSVFITSQLYQEWTLSEVKYLTQAIANSGQIVQWKDGTIFDKHSLGGVPGNKVTLLIVPIIAAAGLMIPKTSSRAITSPSGTADTMEAFGADIEFSIDDMTEIVSQVGGMIAWTGGLNIVPADERIIRDVQFPLGLDPEPMMISSILSKKLAMGVKYLVLDIPIGRGTKVPNVENAKRIAHRFSALGQELGIRVESGITYGSSPVGHAIGPALEAREALEALMNPTGASDSLMSKSTSLAGILLEMAGKAVPGRGQDSAWELLKSGAAYLKFKEILKAQNADPEVKPEDIEIGSAIYEYLAPENGWIVEINNKVIVRAARAAGAPMDKRAGISFLKKKDSVKRGEVVFRLHAPDRKKLTAAEAELMKEPPIVVEGMLLARE